MAPFDATRWDWRDSLGRLTALFRPGARPRRLLVIAANRAAAEKMVRRLRPVSWDAFGLTAMPGLPALTNHVVPVGHAEEIALRERCRDLSRSIVAEMVQGLPVDDAVARFVLPLACEDHLFGPLHVARAVELALVDGPWDCVAVAGSAARRPLVNAAADAARTHGSKVVVDCPAPAAPASPRLPAQVPVPARADTLVVVRSHDAAYLRPALRVAEAMGAATVSTGRRPPDGMMGLGGTPPEWLAAAVAVGERIAGRGGAPGVADGIRAFLNGGLPEIACRADGAEALLDAVRPRRVILFAGRDTVARAITMACRRRGVPTLDVQVVLQSPHPRYRRSLADVFCALTEDQAQAYRTRYDTAHQRVERLGSLRMPELRAQFDAAHRADVRTEAGLGAGVGRVVLMVGQPGFESLAEPTLAAMMAAAEGVCDAAIILKPHPKEDPAPYRRLADGYGGRVSVAAPDIPVHRLLKAVDGVVTYCSNVGIEAAVLGLPVVAANLSGQPFAVDLAAMGAAARADTPDALTAAVRAILAGSAAPTGTLFLSANPEFLGDPLARLAALAAERATAKEPPFPAADPTD